MHIIKHTLNAVFAITTLCAIATQTHATENTTVSERLKPVGQVCISGQPCEGIAVATSSSAGGAMTPDQIIGQHCGACHSTGVLGAPKIGDHAAWKARSDAQGGLSALLAKAKTGLNAMPPRGTCTTCSDDELLATIKKMSGL